MQWKRQLGAKGWGKTTAHLRAQILYYLGKTFPPEKTSLPIVLSV